MAAEGQGESQKVGDAKESDIDAIQIEGFEELWRATFNTYYDAFYNEVVADRIINRWQIVDDTTKSLVALTASGSAIAGWALWNQPGYRTCWAIFAGASAALGIVHTTLTVAHRLRDWGETKRAFSGLRIELETLMYRMKFDFKATTREFEREFIKYRRRYLLATQRIKNDILLRENIKVKAQRDVNRRLQQDQQGASHGS